MGKFTLATAVFVCILSALSTTIATVGCGQKSGVAERATPPSADTPQSPSSSEIASPSPSPSRTATGLDTSNNCGVILSTADGGASWSATYALESQYNDRFGLNSSIAFGDAGHGWMAGGGYIFATDDAGASWRHMRNKESGTSGVDVDLGGLGGGGTCLPTAAGIAVLGEDDAWLTATIEMWVGDEKPAILTTKDGGRHWTVQTLPLQSVRGVAFTDPQKGWAVGDTFSGNESKLTIVATTDGGAHWRTQYSGPQGTFADVAFADDSSGWAVGDNGAIVATSDGGSHWRRQHSLHEVSLRGVAAPDAKHIWAVGVDYAAGKDLILASSDSGMTWTEQDTGVSDANLLDVAFADAMTGWAVGAVGILATTDGGQTWERQPSAGSFDTSEVLITRTDGRTFVKAVAESGTAASGDSMGYIRAGHIAIMRSTSSP
jgi:photosystem II stability/assembly factor-like uncharacterized protein